ncbi:hypothetical protein N9N67_00175 [Bacteriovoracaceae bacterium]|nr:hypothetical protein [Bacteriovoracaceae bacterium]
MLQNYRSSTSRKEILKILKDSSNANTSILWQAFPDHRTIYEINEIETDFPNGVIKVSLNQTEEPINESVPAYIKLSHRETIFKGKVLSYSGESITMSIPDEIKTTELREYPRFNFISDAEKYVVVGVVTDFMRNATQSLKVKLFDISTNGFGAVISEGNKKFFYQGAYVYLEMMDSLKVDPKRLGEVVYLETMTFRNAGKQQKGFKVGIKLIQPLTNNFLSFYVEGVEPANSKTPGVENLKRIVFDDELSKQIEEVISKTVSRLKHNLSFKKVLQSIHISRDPERYYLEHVEALSRVVCSLAKLLNWVSDVTLEKLVYVCYIHDIAFVNHPHLAKIKSMEDFKEIEKDLPHEEREIFMRAPQISLEFWQADKFGPADCDKILIQQMERPDKTGFPKGVGSSKISPLAALFIVSHDFVDYVYENDDWSLPLYIEECRGRLQGGYFSKIIESLKIIQFKI